MIFKPSPRLIKETMHIKSENNNFRKIKLRLHSPYSSNRKSATNLEQHEMVSEIWAEQNPVGFHYFTKGYRFWFYSKCNESNGVVK